MGLDFWFWICIAVAFAVLGTVDLWKLKRK